MAINRNLKQKILAKLKNIYIKSPINFSTITGLRYPGIPRLKGNFLLGRLTTLFKENGALENAIAASQLAEKHPSGLCYFWLGTQVVVLITRAEDVQALKVKHAQYLSLDVPLMRKVLGNSLFTDEPEPWREKRSACKRILSHEAIEQLEPGMIKVIQAYVTLLKNYESQPLTLRTFFFNLIVDVVTINLMGCPQLSTRPGNKQIQIDKLTELSYFFSETLHDVFQFQNLFKCMLPNIIRKIFFKNTNDVESLKSKMQNRYHQLFLTPNRDNILKTKNLIKEIWDINRAQNHHDSYDDQDILGDGLLLLGAGVATTVATLEFAIKLLTAHPDKAEKLRAEINKHLSNNDEITVETLKQMPYVEMVIKETMRLYPPAPLLMPREMSADFELKGIPLFKGTTPLFSPYVMQRSARYWDNPEDFIPERFSKENQANLNLNAYFPFSVGPRFCAGQQFAMQEMKLILIELYRNYHINIENNSFELTLKQGGLTAAIPPVAYLHTLYPAS